MNAITLDSNLRLQLPDLSRPYAIRNESGQVVGRYIPASGKQLEPPFSREEIERRKQQKGKTYTTAEVLAHLEKL